MKKLNLKKLRSRMKLGQDDFWRRVGISQSGGSRYESGRQPPKPVRLLLDVAYGSPRVVRRALDKVRGCA